MNVSDVMTTDIVSVKPDTRFKDLVERLLESDVSGLPVVDDSGTLVGIVTEADLVSKQAFGASRHRSLTLLSDMLSVRDHNWATKAVGSVARDVMSRDLVVCRPDERLQVAARRMLDRGVKRLPVVEDGQLVGILSRQDLLVAALATSDDALARPPGRR